MAPTTERELKLGRPGAEKRMAELRKEKGAKAAKEIQAKANTIALAAGARTIKVEHVFEAEGRPIDSDEVLSYRGRRPPSEKKKPASKPTTPKPAPKKPAAKPDAEKGNGRGNAEAASETTTPLNQSSGETEAGSVTSTESTPETPPTLV